MKKVFLLLCLFIGMVVVPDASAQQIIAVSSGPYHCLVLDSDGYVYEWGSNVRGELTGIKDRNPHYVPLRLPVSNVTAISAGSFHNLALKDDGTVWTWGDMPNEYWSNESVNSASFKLIQVPITNVTAISAGREWALAVKADGSVWSWGMNFQGNFGDGISENFLINPVCQLKPVRAYISDVKYLDTNGEGCFAVKEDGSVWAWGSNVFIPGWDSASTVYGALGDFSSNKTRPSPFKVGMLSDVKAVSQGTEHVLVLKNDGTVWAWGTDYYGQLGDWGRTGQMNVTSHGSEHVFTNSLVRAKIDNVKAISARSYSSMALKNDGTVWVWGFKNDGDYTYATPGNTPYTSVPKRIDGLNDIVSISPGECHFAALKSDGTVWVWGYNSWGQAGDRVGAYTSTPVHVSFENYKEIADPQIISYKDTVDLPTGSMITPTPAPLQTIVNVTGATPEIVSDNSLTNTSGINGGTNLPLAIFGVVGLLLLFAGLVYMIKCK